MANQRLLTAFGEDGSPVPVAQPGATVTDFPVAAQDAITATTSTVAFSDNGGVLLYCGALIHVSFTGTATASSMAYPAGLHLIPVASGDVLSVIANTGTARVHAHIAR